MNIYKNLKRQFLRPVMPERRLSITGPGIILILCILFILFNASSSQASSTAPLQLNLAEFAAGFTQPLGIANAGGDDNRLFVVEKAGRIKIVQPNGDVLVSPFLDIVDRVDSDQGEEGLLGLAFHPDYAANGYFYVNYTHTTGGVRQTRISRFTVTADPNVADPTIELILLTVNQPYSNHNAGDLHFGPDGYLYIPLGDGGDGGDPHNHAQNLENLLGAIVRIDVDVDVGEPASDCNGLGSGSYTIPAGNPFQDSPGNTCDEIWAYGLRNPWRFSFDRQTGDMYIADVGQQEWEEINHQPAGSTGGQNYGWSCYEGTHFYPPGTEPPGTSRCDPNQTYTFPIFEYSHGDDNCSVTGGYVYRGSQYPAMQGHYLFADYCSGIFWDSFISNCGEWQTTRHTNLQQFGFAAFGEDVAGELYVANISDGKIYQLQATAPAPEFTHCFFFPIVFKNS